MDLSQVLEDFSPLIQQGAFPGSVEADLSADGKAQVYEEGYGAGWEDAVKSQSNSAEAVITSMREAVGSAQLTHDAALDLVTGRLVEALFHMFSKLQLLSDIENRAETLKRISENSFQLLEPENVTFYVSPSGQKALSDYFFKHPEAKITTQVDDTLAADQVLLTSNSEARVVDFDECMKSFENALRNLVENEEGNIKVA